jgi:hypothetical protein
VEIDGLVYDGTRKGAFFDRDGYYEATNAEAIRKLSQRELALLIDSTSVWGPCPELEARAAFRGGGPRTRRLRT